MTNYSDWFESKRAKICQSLGTCACACMGAWVHVGVGACGCGCVWVQVGVCTSENFHDLISPLESVLTKQRML